MIEPNSITKSDLSVLRPRLKYHDLIVVPSVSVTRLGCSEQCDDRCYGDLPNECCHPECIGGCTGPLKSDCVVGARIPSPTLLLVINNSNQI